MDFRKKQSEINRRRNRLYLFANTFIVLFIAISMYQIGTSVHKEEKFTKQILIQEAEAYFESILITRQWNAKHGGVYYIVKDMNQTNPYLPDNHLYTANGLLLAKVNPAWMTRQISELSSEKDGYHYKMTSLKPINPSNAAHGFEVQALRYFHKHPNDRFYYKISNDLSYFNFMGSLKTKQSCLVCHAQQGYHLEDIRGGIHISISTTLYAKQLTKAKDNALLLAIILILGSGLAAFFINKSIATHFAYQEYIIETNEALEEKVKVRTKKLENKYRYEKYLKNILRTLADVNQLLVGSNNVNEIITDTANRLKQHKNYMALWVGLVQDTTLHIVYEDSFLFEKKHYPLFQESTNNLINSAFKVLKNGDISIQEADVQQHDHNKLQDTEEASWLIMVPLLYNTKVLGVISICSNRIRGFEPEETHMLQKLALDIATAIHDIRQRERLHAMEKEKIENYEETILAFVNIIEQRDSYTAGHTLRVAKYCRLIAEELGIDQEEVTKLEKAATLHDIGKIATPDAILLKPGRLTDLEYQLIQLHVEAGYAMLSKIKIYKELSEIIRYHHVHYNGNGYPKVKNPDDVPFLSHIMVLADAFDAMTTNRVYKSRKSVQEALEEIQRLSGKQFHPKVVAAALRALKNVTIEETKQLPENELEQKRFAYFFEDSLTGLYNESYLQIILAFDHRTTDYLHVLYLKNFTQYNKIYGWKDGNRLLKKFAAVLESLYKDSLFFRFHGDDFIILNRNNSIKTEILNTLVFLKNANLYVTSKTIALQRESYALDDLDL
jgi:two-component system, LuxR family, sensor histidine kinase TtrS